MRSPHNLLTPAQIKASAHLYEMFPNMQEKVPECRRGVVEFEHFQHSPEAAYVVGAIRNELRTCDPGVQMNIDGVGWMFDTLHEKWMNRTAVVNATGDVLIAGLGMGMILWPILAKPEVRSVTVLEHDVDVIALILPTLDTAPGREKLWVIHVDAREWKPTGGEAFDYIWLDCVPAYGYGGAIMQVQESWIKRFRPFLRPGRDQYNTCQHWGFEENLLWMLHGPREQHLWPKADRRCYPIGPPDPEIAALWPGYEDEVEGELKGARTADEILEWGIGTGSDRIPQVAFIDTAAGGFQVPI